MKKFSVILASLVIGLMLASAAQAVTAPPLEYGYNGLFFTNSEVFKNNVGAEGNNIDVGDQFWGTLNAQNIDFFTNNIGKNGSLGWNPNNPTYAPPKEISGYFALEVEGIYNVTDGSGADVTLILYGPTTDPNKILTQTNEVMRIFTDDDFSYNTSTRTSGVNSVTEGDHAWSLGFEYDEPFLTGIGDTLDATGYYYSFTPGHDNTDIDAGEPGIVAYGGFNFLDGSPLAPIVRPICDPNDVTYNEPCVGNISTDTGLLVDLFFTAKIIVDNEPDGDGALDDKAFDVGSEDPAVINVIPEPATMLLFGTGLMGLAGTSRRRRKAAKK